MLWHLRQGPTRANKGKPAVLWPARAIAYPVIPITSSSAIQRAAAGSSKSRAPWWRWRWRWRDCRGPVSGGSAGLVLVRFGARCGLAFSPPARTQLRCAVKAVTLSVRATLVLRCGASPVPGMYPCLDRIHHDVLEASRSGAVLAQNSLPQDRPGLSAASLLIQGAQI